MSMIHEIGSGKLINHWKNRQPENKDWLIVFKDNRFLLNEKEQIRFPYVEEFAGETVYLFSIEEENYFLYLEEPKEQEGYLWVVPRYFRDCSMRKEQRFAAMVANHLAVWYSNSKYCGHCGNRLVHSTKERMMECPVCGNMVYPRISPAVIVAVIDGDSLLMSKYTNQQGKRYNLVAGFVEIGETLEDCCIREVLEETGIHIHNVRYYRSQPWGLSGSLLAGFVAEAIGDKTITLDENELSEACWIKREEIECEWDDFSLTNEMIMKFKEGK